MDITTNWHHRELVAFHDVPEKVRNDQFDYVEPAEYYSNRFFCYRGWWYDAYEFEATSSVPFHYGELADKGWHGVQSDSVWSGIAIRYVSTGIGYSGDMNYDWETVIVASLYWG